MNKHHSGCASVTSGIVYVTVNLVNEKCYVGIDTKDRPNYLGSGKLFRLARKKYGDENFAKMTIVHFATIKEGCALERFWIKELNTKAPNGYNLNDGGDGQFNPCEATRAKLREHCSMKRPETRAKVLGTKRPDTSVKLVGNTYAKGSKRTDVAKVLMSAKLIGNTHAKGKHWKLSDAAKAKRMGNTNAKGKNLGNTYAKGKNLGNTFGKANKGKKYLTKVCSAIGEKELLCQRQVCRCILVETAVAGRERKS